MKIQLTKGKVATIDDEDWLLIAPFNWYASEAQPGTFYAVTNMRDARGRRKRFSMHRWIMAVTDPKLFVDHINGNPLDNRRGNLRLANNAQNHWNQKRPSNSTSGYKGVYWAKNMKKWRAHIKVNGKSIVLGYYETARDAALAYDQAAIQYFGEFARPNLTQQTPT